jgi:uncharacterized phage infection (PIP) family protein YhgE
MLSISDALEDSLKLAVIDENWKHRVGRQTDLRIKFNAPDLTVRQEGYFQIINLEGHEITIGANATDEQIGAEIARIRKTEPKMPTIAEQIKAAKAKIAEVRAGAATSAAEAASIAQIAAEEVAKLEKMNEELRAELAGLNGGEPL